MVESAVLQVENRPADEAAGPAAAAGEAPGDADTELLVEEIRIDDVSIDGMCGVY